MEVTANLVESLFVDGNPGPAGSYKFYKITEEEGTAGLNFVCPCGCESILGVSLAGPNAWQWNEDRNKPTVTPSIRRLDGCKWHGYLTDGVFKSC
jgi:hypothetical protein